MHRIRRQILDIELPSGAGAGIWQQRFSRVFQERVLPRLDDELSRIAPPGRFIRIDRLEIDAGAFNDALGENRFVEDCVRQIAQKVAEAVAKSSATEPAQSETLGPEERMVEIFRYFLETGRLPWFAPETPVREMEAVLLPVIRAYPGAFSGDFLPLLRQNRRALQRLIWQFSPAFTQTALETAMNLPADWLEQAGQTIKSLLGRDWEPAERTAFISALIQLAQEAGIQREAPRAEWLAQVWYQSQIPEAEVSASGKPRDTNPPGALSKDAPEAGSPNATVAVDEKKRLPGEEPVMAGPAGNASAVQGEVVEKQPSMGVSDMPAPFPENRPLPAEPARPEPSGGREIIGTPAQTVRQPRAHPGWSGPAMENILLHNAGLVLVAVYLPAFFEALKLTDGKDFTSLEQQYKGIHLLHFLATGEEFAEEPYLTLPKILCGLSPDEPVPSDIRLSEQAKNESTRLLQAVIRNWSMLKNTGPDGLRNAFLQRAGLLGWSDDRMAWLLRVERQAQDLLLDRLPWSYSVVKLPWMPQMLQVEW